MESEVDNKINVNQIEVINPECNEQNAINKKNEENFENNENIENVETNIENNSENSDTMLINNNVRISKLGYVTFILFGLTMLCAWNLWITAVPFFKYRLAGTIFHDNFQNYISISFMFTNTLSALITLKIQQKIDIDKRIVGSLLLLIFCFSVTTFLSLINTINPYIFFIIIMILIIISAISTAILQNGGFGLVAQLSNIYTQGIMNGQGLAGAVVVLIQIAIVLNTNDTDDDTGDKPSFLNNMYLYFLAVVLISILCLIGYNCVIKKIAAKTINESIENLRNRNNDVTQLLLENEERNDNNNNDNNNENNREVNENANNNTSSRVENISSERRVWNILLKIRYQALSLFCIFVVTLALFPSIVSGIESINKSTNSNYYNNLFVSIAFLIYTLGDWLGKVMPGYPKLVFKNIYALTISSFSRIVFILLFMMCNVQFQDTYGDPLYRTMPVLIRSDVVYFILMLVFAVSNGYISSLILMITPEFVNNDEKELSGSIMVFVLTLGLACGSLFSFIIRALLCKCNPFIS